MLGLTFDKLLLIGVLAAFILGPRRLPVAAATLGRWVRQLKQLTSDAKARLKEEAGPEYEEIDWRRLDPRQYDPRRIIREALLEDTSIGESDQAPEVKAEETR